MSDKLLAVLSVQGRDQKGVVAQFATFVAERGINIEDLEQRVVSGLFVMDMLIDLKDMTVSLDELVTGALDVGKKINMEVKVTLQRHPRSKRVIVLASKEPHCLEKLLKLATAPDFNGQFVAVIANHPTLEPLARAANVPFECLPCSSPDQKAAHMAALLKRLRELKPDLIVLARYMQILSPEIVNAFPSRIINIHPSLLPFFPGASPYRQAFESGARVTGCTAHFVTEQLDQGPIILQDVFHINVGSDSADDVRERGLTLEADILAKSVKFFLDEELVVINGKVVFKPGISSFSRAKE
ncbi:MAG TPA: formyltetrahydrofolate deformylase [Phycisphaerae bacterium]|nr:formyltetrahydrofolate deformylase [Phycisphaerae bacterium]